MKTIVIVREPENRRATLSVPTARALETCFSNLGWRVRQTTDRINYEPDLVAGWGFRDVIHESWDRWPDRVLHVDAGFWRRETYNKIALGHRWSEFTGKNYPVDRFKSHNIPVYPNRAPGKTILVCGMSAKASRSWGFNAPEEWEREAVSRLRAVGAKVIYRPKPTWPDARPIQGSMFDRGVGIETTLRQVYGVVSHHSNAAVDALAAGLPIYVDIGISKSMSVPRLEDIVGATAPDQDIRERFLREIAWHQWSMAEIERGAWLKSPAPLSSHPIFREG